MEPRMTSPNTRPMIHVTQPSLAPLEDLTRLLEGVWERGILTHNGPLVRQLEDELCGKLGVSHLALVANGTLAIQMAIKALGLKGEIITTPFTWIATVSSIMWEGCTPVFCDIEPDTLNIDPKKIEACITPRTSAIMPVHVFGNPCKVEEIQEIADRHNLKVIYDAAHAVGSTYQGRSLLEYGDISATSLHATKLLNTGEGGACVTRDPELHEKLKRIRFFGHDDSKDIVEEGMNGKMTEIHAALGLANLSLYDAVLADRKRKYRLYLELLACVPGLSFQKAALEDSNCSYFAVLFPTEGDLLRVEKALQAEGIFARRYFHPSVNTYRQILPYVPMPVSENASSRILCLPLFYRLEDREIERIAATVSTAL